MSKFLEFLKENAILEELGVDYDMIDLDYDEDEDIDEDEYSLDVDDDTIGEKVVRKKVVRGGKAIVKKVTDKAGYKVKDGREIRMSPREQQLRKKAAKKAARKRKSSMKQSQAKRQRSIKRRTFA